MTRTEAAGPDPVDVDPRRHLTSRLWEQADLDHEIARYHDGQEWRSVSWHELAERVRALAAGLIAAGISPGDRVALMSGTRLEWTVTDLAILAVGGVTVPIYETDSTEQCAWVLSDSGARLAFAASGDAHAKRLQDARTEAPDLENVIVFDEGGVDEQAERGREVDPDEIVQRADRLSAEDLASIVYTSGTTGRPKGCALTHGNIVWTTAQAKTLLDEIFAPGESTLLFLPLAHIFTRLIQFGCMETDAVMGYARSLDDLPEDLAEFQPTFLLAVPRVFDKVYRGARRKATGFKRKVFDFSADAAQEWSKDEDPGLGLKLKHTVSDKLVYAKLRDGLGGQVRHCISGGAPLSEHLARFFTAAGITILQGYGLTETTAPATIDRPGSVRIGTVGRPIPGVEIRIAPINGDDSEADGGGEVQVRGRNVFSGYWQNDEATEETFDGDWFATGDLGELDDDGYLTITGRTKELIVTASGKNVAPEPLEERIKSHPLVAQPVVIGDDRPFVAALITLDEEELESFARENGIEGTADDVRSHDKVRAEVQRAIDEANEMVSRAESIREFAVLDRELSQERDELTPTMKPRRRDIAEHFAEEIEQLYSGDSEAA